MVRAPIVDKDGVRRGAWSLEEDFKLRAYVEKYGPWKWREVPRLAGLTRCGKSCRLRWLNYLRPGLKRGNYTSEENELICKLHEKHGNRWSTIAAKLPGRTDNEVKNHWNAHLKKQVKPNPESSSITDQPKAKQSGPNDIITSSHVVFEAKPEDFSDYSSTTFGILESSSVSSQQTSSSDNDNYFRTQNWAVDQDYVETNGYVDFWTEPFVWDHNRNNVGHVLDASLQFSAEYGVFSPQHETTYDDNDYNIDLFSAFYCNFGSLK